MTLEKRLWLVGGAVSTVAAVVVVTLVMVLSKTPAPTDVKPETVKVYVTETNTVYKTNVTERVIYKTNVVDFIPPVPVDILVPPAEYEFSWKLSQGQKINGLSSAGPYPALILTDTTNNFSFYLSYKVVDGTEGICVYSLTKTEDGCWTGQWVQTNPRAWGTVLADKTDDGLLVGQFESDQNKDVKPFFRIKRK